MKLLVADDDERILRLIADYFKHYNYQVTVAMDGGQALEAFNREDFDLVILDVMMPIYDGWIVCKEIRKKTNVPVIILTARDSDLDELFGFEIGADDYVSKPFNLALLLARVKRLLKRGEVKEDLNMTIYKEFSIEEDKHIATFKGVELDLNPKEYELLIYFINNKDKVISRETLLRVVWGDEYYGDTRTVDTHINRLRNKLGEGANYLKTIRGFGYKLGE